MVYRRSDPLQRWLSERSAVIGVLAGAHASSGRVSGPGRPLDVSKPLAHAYIIGMLTEFQGFVRDLHDLTVERLLSGAGASTRFAALLSEGLTQDRGVDRGNATLSAIKSDFRRLGLTPLTMQRHNARWGQGDAAYFDELVRLRNVLAHGNEGELRKLRNDGVVDTVTWARGRLPVLNRVTKSLDRLVWDHLLQVTGAAPWR